MKERLCLFALLVGVLSCHLNSAVAEDAATDKVILDTTSTFWRVRTIRETDEVATAPGKVEHVRFTFDRNFFQKNPTAVAVDQFKTEPVPVIRLPADTPADWMKPGFNDSTWARAQGPLFVKSQDLQWKLILLRGLFEVGDPAKAGALKLSVDFRGGCVVYLNGDELTRSAMPQGEITPLTPAEPYPTAIYLDEAGYLSWRHDDPGFAGRAAKRVRSIKDFLIPAGKLKRGVNLLAIAIHRAPSDPVVFTHRIKRYPLTGTSNQNDIHWSRAALLDVRLTAPPASSAVPNTSWPKDKGFRVWNLSVVSRVYSTDYPDPFAALQPVFVLGVRNGTFAGQVVVGDDKAISGLRAEASDLKGPGVIPASAIRVRYAIPDGERRAREARTAFDSLEDLPPAQVAVNPATGGAIQPVWITVAVPADAKAGDYKGTLTIRADGVKPVAIPIELRVTDWALPDTRDFITRMDIVESPESLAMAYDVPLWSDEHWRLLDRTFELLAPLSVRTLYITCIRRTHWGNEHAMVRWSRNADGDLEPDFSIAEKYLDVATKHLGKVPAVILYCWEPIESMGHAGGAGGAGRTTDKPILYTLVDKKTGSLRGMTGPAWGTPEAAQFWTKLSDGMQKILDKRGMKDSMLFGLVGDARPTKQAMADISAGAPKTGWACHSHYYCVNWNGYDMGLAVALWGVGCNPVEPTEGYGFGWNNPFWLNYYPREMELGSSLVEYRTKLEKWMGAPSRSKSVYSKASGTRGLGRLGANFWVVLKDGRGRPSASLAGRYPESYWGQLNLNYGVPYVLGMGKTGPVPTVRSEAFRENIQEVEARIVLEGVLIDPAKQAKVGEDLVRRIKETIDERIRIGLYAEGEGLAWFVSSDWAARTGRLFELTAEAAKKLAQ